MKKLIIPPLSTDKPIGDGVALKCMEHPPGLITKLYLAILDGRLSTKKK